MRHARRIHAALALIALLAGGCASTSPAGSPHPPDVEDYSTSFEMRLASFGSCNIPWLRASDWVTRHAIMGQLDRSQYNRLTATPGSAEAFGFFLMVQPNPADSCIILIRMACQAPAHKHTPSARAVLAALAEYVRTGRDPLWRPGRELGATERYQSSIR
jgi:hypothetical protein